MVKIIDVSEFNGNVDFEKVKAAGISGVIIRCGLTGYGVAKNKYIDRNFEKNYAAAVAAGLPVGVFWYSCAVTEDEAAAEAAKTIELLAGKTMQLPVYWDTEDNHDVTKAGVAPQNQRMIGKAKLTACANVFLDAIRAAGYVPGIYGSSSWLEYQLDMQNVRTDNVWVAQYYKECQYRATVYDMWQYTSSGSVDGVSGRADVSECYFDIPLGKTVDELAAEVMAGKWGNGTERKVRLAAAGYDYDAVQAAVNALVGAAKPVSAPVRKSNEEVAKEVLRGVWGNGGTRRQKLIAAGYDYGAVQAIVNKLMG